MVCAGKVFVYWMGTEPFLYIAEPEFLRQATSGILGKSWGKPDVFKHDRKAMFGGGLLMSEGDSWTQHRHIITPAFSATNLSVRHRSSIYNEHTQHWRDVHDLYDPA